MKKDFVSVFNNDISIDEYELDNLLDKNIKVKENEFPTILIDKEDDTNKYININNNSNLNNENIEDNAINIIEPNEIKETENITNENDLSQTYTEEENNLYNDAKNNISLTEDDLNDIENVEEFNLENAVFGDKKNIKSEENYKNNSEKFNMEDSDLKDNYNNNEEYLHDDASLLSHIEEGINYLNSEEQTGALNINNNEEENLLSENEELNNELNDIDKEFPQSDNNDSKEIDLMEEDNLKKEDEILEYEDKEVILPSVDNVDYIDENDYIKNINSSDEVIELSGNELDLITKDKDINDDRKNIIEISDNNMRKDNFLLEKQIDNMDNINNETENIDKEKEEQEKTNYYINKFKKLHDEYIKSIEENKENENNKANNEIEIKTENNEDRNIENVESEKVENVKEANKIESPIIEERDEIKEELKTEESKTNETETIENEPAHIKDVYNETENIDKEKEEQEKTNYYINKFKKLHDEYIKSIEENKESENNKINNGIEIKTENNEDKNIENVECEKVENVKEANEIESSIIEETEETKSIENTNEAIKEEERTDYYINKFKKLHDEYIKSIEENKESENNKANNEIEINEPEDIKALDNSEITDKLSAEEEEMYKAYLGEDTNLIEDIIPKENEDEENQEINIELENAKNELKKKEETLNKLETIGELSEEEEDVFDDILQQNKNKYYEDDINNADIILKELNLDEIEEIDENDFNILENFILGKEQENGTELISVNNENKFKKEHNNDNLQSVDDFDSIDEEELSKAKENTMAEEKELYESEKGNIDLNAKVEEEFSLNKEDNEAVLTNEKTNNSENNKGDFDGEITQMDLDLAEKLFETEDQKNSEDYGPKHDLLLSESDINKFRKLFSYFKIIVEKLPQEYLNDFAKTEFYDIYSSLFRKFGE